MNLLAHYIIHHLSKKYNFTSEFKVINANEYSGFQFTSATSHSLEHLKIIIHELCNLEIDDGIFNQVKSEIMAIHKQYSLSHYKALIRDSLNYYLNPESELVSSQEIYTHLINLTSTDFKNYYTQFHEKNDTWFISTSGGISRTTFEEQITRISNTFIFKKNPSQHVHQEVEITPNLIKKTPSAFMNKCFSYICYPAATSSNQNAQWMQRILKDYLNSINGPLYHIARNGYNNRHSNSYVLAAHSTKLSSLGTFLLFWKSENSQEEETLSDRVFSLLDSISKTTISFSDFVISKERVKLKFIKKRNSILSTSHFLADNMLFNNSLDYRLHLDDELNAIQYDNFLVYIRQLIKSDNHTCFFRFY